jgi:hypothetical protein
MVMGAFGEPIAFAVPEKAGAVEAAGAAVDFVAALAGALVCRRAVADDTTAIMATKRKIPIRWYGDGSP